MKKYLYPERNKLFIILSIFMCISGLVIARYSTLPAFPGFGFLVGPQPKDFVFYDIAMGFTASYIFYLIQIYIPQRNRELKSLETLSLDIKAYVRNANIFCMLLYDYEFTKLPQYVAEGIPTYYYRNEHYIIVESFVGAKDDLEQMHDGVYNFLLKTKNIYEQMISNPVFSTMDLFLVEQIQKVNMLYWFDTYEKILVLKKSNYNEEIRPFCGDEEQMQLLKQTKTAVRTIEEYLRIESIVSKEPFVPDDI